MSFVTTPSPLPIWMGGTGRPYLTPNRLILANGYDPVLGIPPGPAGTALGSSDGSTWSYLTIPSATTPGGSNTYVQYNNSGAFGGSANFVWDNSNVRLGIGTSSPEVKLDISETSSGAVVTQTFLRNPAALAANTAVRLSMSAVNTSNRFAYIQAGVTGASDNGHYLAFGTNELGTGPVERARFTALGNLLVGTTTNNASGGVIQVSNGITFPATQSASSDANTLDDYEEGTWTYSLAVSSASSGPTISSNVATYTKIGRLVHITCEISYSGVNMTGVLQITGLPFTAASTPRSSLSVGLIQFWSEATPFPPLTAYADGTRIYMTRLTNAAYGSDQFPTDDNGGTILIGGCYYV